MLNVTLKHYSTAFTDEIASRPSVNHQSHLYGSYALIMILFEQPFTFRIWKYVDARAKWENVWRKTREFQVVRNSCLNQWHFPHARTVTWYEETHICKRTCCPHILGIRRYLYRIVFFSSWLLASSAEVSRSARLQAVVLSPPTLSVNWRAALSCLLPKTPPLKSWFRPSDGLFLICSFPVLFRTYLTTVLTSLLE